MKLSLQDMQTKMQLLVEELDKSKIEFERGHLKEKLQAAIDKLQKSLDLDYQKAHAVFDSGPDDNFLDMYGNPYQNYGYCFQLFDDVRLYYFDSYKFLHKDGYDIKQHKQPFLSVEIDYPQLEYVKFCADVHKLCHFTKSNLDLTQAQDRQALFKEAVQHCKAELNWLDSGAEITV